MKMKMRMVVMKRQWKRKRDVLMPPRKRENTSMQKQKQRKKAALKKAVRYLAQKPYQ